MIDWGNVIANYGFVIAAYGVILGGIALYAGLLARRLRIARDATRRTDDVDTPG